MLSQQEKLFEFIGQALSAFHAGQISAFAESHFSIPKPREMARLAQEEYQSLHGNFDFNPFKMTAPGDAVLDISRGLEYEIFKSFEIRRRSMELVKLLLGTDPEAVSINQVLMNIVTEFYQIDGILLSAAQTRKSRAGASFELHIERLLTDGGIPHEVQVIADAKKRPDFVLPSFTAYMDPLRDRTGALVLSAKTTLRERWKQVQGEIRNCDLFLATVDEGIAENAIKDMERQGIVLVVPESLKKSDTTVYKSQSNVISFKSFFETELLCKRMVAWQCE
nr:type II restriction endonuclease [Duganella guangzhouensis]